MTEKEANAAHIREALRRASGIVAWAARMLGMPRASLYGGMAGAADPLDGKGGGRGGAGSR